ncbi:MAG TPA: formate--tetrahydrofolate ligase [Myxococcota bacterium]|jgi:formate--tetrahydrofolate ligase|nr:formate--tetrahydrofolate ligase [Myxococcota bacterium]
MASIRPELLSAAQRLGLAPDDLVPFGLDAAKVDPGVRARPRRSAREAKLLLVSAITPTPAGEGKTTTSIGLADALARIGESVCVALREPSQGPCLGAKGGGTGGGASQLVPSDRINLHFTGDFHAIASAHNLLAALVDNHLHHGNALDLDARRVLWRRVLDMNDRALREIVSGLGGVANGFPRETGFDITAASEVMAMLCLAEDEADLRRRLERTIVAFRRGGTPVTAADLGAPGAMLALLRDALWPNLVRTAEGTPAFVHGGPFANIAHGCSSVIATKLALHLADWVVTEAGFGFDQGAEKFFDLKCTSAGLDTAAVVLVTTARALRLHGGVELRELATPDAVAVGRGIPNLEKHVENIRAFGESPIVALNRHGGDTAEEIDVVRAACSSLGVPFAVSDHFAKGGEGALDLARTVMSHAESRSSPFRALYAPGDPPTHKIRTVARRMYGARSVIFTKAAEHDLAEVERLGLSKLPVCIAKTHSSLTDDPKIYGRPRDFDLTVRGIQINAGAGFLVVLTGDILRMPGLPKRPLAERIDLRDGEITGLA